MHEEATDKDTGAKDAGAKDTETKDTETKDTETKDTETKELKDKQTRGTRMTASSRRLKIVFGAALLLIFIGGGCRRVSPQDESNAAVGTTQWIDRRFGFVEDPEVVSLVYSVTARLGAAVYGEALEEEASGFDISSFEHYPWQVFIVKSDKPNAFSAGAGVIFITEGMLRNLQAEAELAAIISHEMAHQLLGHLRAALADGGTGSSPRFAFTLEDELAADTLGVKILKVARYDPRFSLSAITNSYRARDGIAVPIHEEWLSARTASLSQHLKVMTPSLPATGTSAAFTRMQEKLSNS
jgi:hypothetical protein